MGRWWVDSPGPPAPFDREPEELDGEPAERPPTTVHVEEVEPYVIERGAAHISRRDLGTAAGSTTTGIKHVVIAAGRDGYPPHCHSAEEEIFVVLGGEGVAFIGEEVHPIRRGSVIARPPATGVPHFFRAGAEPLEYLAWGTREPNDIVFYPRSGKVSLRGVGVIGRIEPLDYWEGEE
jgi:uncharacterized cupin superfamily protein